LVQQIVDTRDRAQAVSQVFQPGHARDHVNEWGFSNDGYDYAQHLKEMGGGKFIAKDGHMYELEKPKPVLALPEDVLPSETMLRRDYEAITIAHGQFFSSLLFNITIHII
jgi:hypothetical protein